MKNLLYISILFFSLTVSGQRMHLIKDGEIIQSGIPEKFVRENGEQFWGGYKSRTDLHYVDGWRDEVRPVIDYTLQKWGERYYDIGNDVVTWVVVDKVLPTLEEAKTQKIKELREAVKGLYGEIQWIVEMYRTNDEAIPVDIRDKIKLIRTKYIQFKNNINAQTDVVDVLKIEIPYTQIEIIRNDFDNVY